MTTILREIGMIARALDSISNIEFKELNMTKGQYLYLIRIYEHPGIIQEKVAEMLMVDRTTAARAVQKLEQQEFIEKRDDATNKKIKKLYVTEKGAAVYPYLKRENDYSDAVALEGFNDEEKQLLQNMLEKMRHQVEVEWDFVKKGNKRQY